MNPKRLVEMANDIAINLSAYPDHTAAIEIMVTHLQRFWEPSMRETIIGYLQTGGDGLEPFAREAITQLQQQAGAGA